ncbi:MAG TPA: hypothetical protein VFX54_21805, partial [Candidatus Binatia bacterium]|nr:hypothetical protein [Candidatus Binatia bacterium]
MLKIGHETEHDTARCVRPITSKMFGFTAARHDAIEYQCVAKDEYLLQLIRYIHLNPVRAGMVRSPERYRHSGHHTYLQGKATETMDPRAVLSMLGGKPAYRRFVQDGLSEGHKEEYYAVEDQRFLGGKGFGESLLKKKPSMPDKNPTLSIDTAA